jgi:hypothetical protein
MAFNQSFDVFQINNLVKFWKFMNLPYKLKEIVENLEILLIKNQDYEHSLGYFTFRVQLHHGATVVASGKDCCAYYVIGLALTS